MTSTNPEQHIAEALFLAKIFGLWIFFLLSRAVWEKLVRAADNIPVLHDLLVPTDDRGLVRAFCLYVWSELSRRIWLVRLALSSVHGSLFLLMQMIVIYQLGMRGFINDLSPVIRAESPADWIFFFGDPAVLNLSAMFALGLFLTLLFVRPLLVSTLALMLMFTGVLSVAGAFAMLVAERLAIHLIFFFAFRDRVKLMDLVPVVSVSAVTGVFAIFWSRDFMLSWGDLLGIAAFKPWDRFALLTFALVFVGVIETAVRCAFYHFYFIATADEKAIEAFPIRQLLWAGWVSSDLKAAILGRAAARFEAIEKMDGELEAGEMKSQLPSALLARMQKEKRELRKLLKA